MTDLPAAGLFTAGDTTNDGAKTAQDAILAFIRQMPGGSARSTLTIASGAITPTRGQHDVDTEGGAGADDLTNILTTNIPDGGLLRIHAVNASRVPTVKHAAGGAGAVSLNGAADFALDTLTKWLLLQRKGTDWVEIDRFPALIAAATDTAAGLVEKATQAETDAGTDDSRFVSPLLLSTSIYAAADNVLINGGFAVNQRQATSVADDAYCLDRWYALAQSGNVTIAQQTFQEDGSPFNIRLTQPDVSAKRIGLAQIIEGKNCTHLRGQAVTFAIRGRFSAGANLRFALLEWTGTEDAVTSDVVNDWTSGTYTGGNFFNSTTLTVRAVGSQAMSAATWADLALSATLGTTFTNLIVLVWTEGTLAQNGTLDLARGRLNRGASRIWRPLPFGAELAACQRYYNKTFAYATAPAQNVGSLTGEYQWGAQRTGTGSDFTFAPFPALMRGTPSVTFYNPAAANGQVRDLDVPGDCSSTAGSVSARGVRISCAGNASTAIGNTLAVHFAADAEL